MIHLKVHVRVHVGVCVRHSESREIAKLIGEEHPYALHAWYKSCQLKSECYLVRIKRTLITKSRSRCSIVVSIPACHAGDPGSIPGNGDNFFGFFSFFFVD